MQSPRGCDGRKGGTQAHGIGRSRGGLTTKIHAAVDALGLPVRLIPTAGQRGDIRVLNVVLSVFAGQHVGECAKPVVLGEELGAVVGGIEWHGEEQMCERPEVLGLGAKKLSSRHVRA